MRERLYRSRSDRMLFGVAGGMADWFDLDPSLVRLVWAILVLAGGVGVLLYIVAAIVIPEEPLGAAPATGPEAPGTSADPSAAAAAASADDWHARREARRAARAQRSGTGAMIFGLALVVVGAWFLLSRFLKIDSDILVPAVLIALGAALVIGALARPGRGGA